MKQEFYDMCQSGIWNEEAIRHLHFNDYQKGLILAVEFGRLEVVQKLLTFPHWPKGFNPRFDDGELAFVALKNADQELLLFLLEGDYPQKIDINQRNGEMLFQAISHEQVEMVLFLIGDPRLSKHIRPDVRQGDALKRACLNLNHMEDMIHALTSSEQARLHQPKWDKRHDQLVITLLQYGPMNVLNYLCGPKMPPEQRFHPEQMDADVLLNHAVYHPQSLNYVFQMGKTPNTTQAFEKAVNIGSMECAELLFKKLPSNTYVDPPIDFSYVLERLLKRETNLSEQLIRRLWAEPTQARLKDVILNIKAQHPKILNEALPVLYELDRDFTRSLLNAKVRKTPHGAILADKFHLMDRVETPKDAPVSKGRKM